MGHVSGTEMRNLTRVKIREQLFALDSILSPEPKSALSIKCVNIKLHLPGKEDIVSLLCCTKKGFFQFIGNFKSLKKNFLGVRLKMIMITSWIFRAKKDLCKSFLPVLHHYSALEYLLDQIYLQTFYCFFKEWINWADPVSCYSLFLGCLVAYFNGKFFPKQIFKCHAKQGRNWLIMKFLHLNQIWILQLECISSS